MKPWYLFLNPPDSHKLFLVIKLNILLIPRSLSANRSLHLGSMTQHSTGNRPLEKRKLDYVHLANGAEPRSPMSVTKSISQNHARNEASIIPRISFEPI
ncbi:unnamed protein product [Somion occarium]|uniref:Uncharacterized protein n=1 Tax=Somion occarium TaxID=3059160 RepID=A0ABP1DEY1_9APHY